MSEKESIKFLADVNIEKPIIDHLLEIGYNILWVTDINCQMDDDDLLKLANKERRILITNDRDFGEFVFRQGRVSEGVILIRLKGHNVKEKIHLLKKLVLMHKSKLKGHFTVLTKKKIRIIPMEKAR